MNGSVPKATQNLISTFKNLGDRQEEAGPVFFPWYENITRIILIQAGALLQRDCGFILRMKATHSKSSRPQQALKKNNNNKNVPSQVKFESERKFTFTFLRPSFMASDERYLGSCSALKDRVSCLKLSISD